MKKNNKDYFEQTTDYNGTEFDYIGDKFPLPLNKSNFSPHFFSIVSLFAEDCSYNIIDLHARRGNLYIYGGQGKDTNDLMLRYKQSNSLIVANVQFINRRKGNMTKLFKILKKIKKDYNLELIEIQSVQSDEMLKWCAKHGFKKICLDQFSYVFN